MSPRSWARSAWSSGQGEDLTCREHRREEPIMELTLLTVPACPNAAAFEERLAAAPAGRPGVVVHRPEVRDGRAATQAGMLGSPTPLLHGGDPFAPPGPAPSPSCRLE